MDKKFPARIYGLLGYPVKHSLSPAMHNAAFKALNINAEYRLFEVKAQDLDSFLHTLSQKNICGLNVTVPYKEKVLDFVTLDRESFYLRQIKAVNTIVLRDGIWKGFNSDIAGFARHLGEDFISRGKKTAILGAGGAARAVAYVLANSAAQEIKIFDIDGSKSKNVADMIKGIFPAFNISAVSNIDELELEDKDLLVNATPVGLNETDPCPVSEDKLHKNLFVYDLIYNPAETKLLSAAKSVGAKVDNGLGMLLYQGMLSFEIWTNKVAPESVMRKSLQEELKNAGNNK